MNAQNKCFACDRPLRSAPGFAWTSDGQKVYVGSECWKHIRKTGREGWQPPKGGPRLYDPVVLFDNRTESTPRPQNSLDSCGQ